MKLYLLFISTGVRCFNFNCLRLRELTYGFSTYIIIIIIFLYIREILRQLSSFKFSVKKWYRYQTDTTILPRVASPTNFYRRCLVIGQSIFFTTKFTTPANHIRATGSKQTV